MPLPATTAAPRRERIRGLDGMRGLAFLLVFVVHVRLPAGLTANHPIIEELKEAGWIGVPFFFVISGYLITRLCLEEGREFSLRRFYARRSLRLFPLYFMTVLFALLAWRVPFLREIRIAAAPEWALPLTTFTTNFYLHAGSLASLGAAVVFWTLAVEEQFYVVWGTVMRYVRKAALPICLGILAFSLIARLTVPVQDYFMFYRTQTAVAFGSLMCGCVLALVGTRGLRLGPALTSALTAGLGVVIVALAVLEWPLPTSTLRAALLINVVDLIAVAFLLLALCGSGPLATFLNSSVLRRIGTLSYAAYVTHLFWLWLYYALMDAYLKVPRAAFRPSLLVLIDAAVVLSITLAFASAWHHLEAPFRAWRHRLRTPDSADAHLPSALVTTLPVSVPVARAESLK